MAHSPRSASRISGVATLLAAAAFSLGCATLPMTGVPATGEPLLADVTTERVNYVGRARVGEVVSKDASGNVIGTSEVYEDQLMSTNITRWQVFQGNNRIDDEDFFRIGGDIQAADQIADRRERAVITNRVGWAVLGVGVAAVVGGLVLRSALAEEDKVGSITTTTPFVPGQYIALGGALAAIVGGSLVWYSNAVAHLEHPLDDPRRAKRVERGYNKRLGVALAAAPSEEGPRRKLPKRHEREDETEE
jgi:hypothetical protein